MRAFYIAAALSAAFLLGAFVEHAAGGPFGMALGFNMSSPFPKPAATVETGNTAVPHYSNVRGQEDAPRAELPQGARTDFQRCVNTMILRREPEAEARTVCQKIIAGISG